MAEQHLPVLPGAKSLRRKADQHLPVLLCGAKHFAQRYRDGMKFRNPAIYGNLDKVIRHIEPRVRADISAAEGRCADHR